MSSAIPIPWIATYLVECAETYGGDLIAILPRERGARVQLVKFITYPNAGDDSYSIWVILSDKKHHIIARFSREAVDLYRKDPRYGGKPISEHKTAYIVIKKFRPFFARVPREGGKGMSAHKHIALDVDFFDLKGSFGEPMWGSPVDIESHESIREWCKGLQEDGGGGNILKQKKKELMAANTDNANTGAGPRERKFQLEAARLVPLPAIKTGFSPLPLQTSSSSRKPADARKIIQRRWRPLGLAPQRYQPSADILNSLKNMRHEDSDIEDTSVNVASPETRQSALPSTPLKTKNKRHVLDMSSSPEGSVSPSQRLPATPSQWSPSVRGSPISPPPSDTDPDLERGVPYSEASPMQVDASTEAQQIVLAEQEDILGTAEFEHHQPVAAPQHLPSTFSSYISPPTPAQRPKPMLFSSSLPTSMPPPVDSDIANPASAQSKDVAVPRPLHIGRGVSRKLPFLSGASEPFASLDMSGPGRILVPNSDTSGSISQSQSLPYPSQSSQLQPRSQSLPYVAASQIQSQSEKVYGRPLSQLRDEVEVEASLLVSEENGHDISEAEAVHPAVELRDNVPRRSWDSKGHVLEPETPVKVSDAVEEQPHATGLVEGSGTEEDTDLEVGAADADDEEDKSDVDEGGEIATDYDHSGTDDSPDDSSDQIEERAFSAHDEQQKQIREDGNDSDDARTAAMVDEYIASIHINQSLTFEHPLPVPSIQNNDHSSVRSEYSEGPERPSSPDVFLSEASFHTSTDRRSLSPKHTPSPLKRSPPRRVASKKDILPYVIKEEELPQPQPSTSSTSGQPVRAAKKTVISPAHHDADAWALPSFMRKQVLSDTKGKKKATSEDVPPVRIGGEKRVASQSPRPEVPRAAKKQKVNVATVTSTKRPIVRQRGTVDKPIVIVSDDEDFLEPAKQLHKTSDRANPLPAEAQLKRYAMKQINLRRAASSSSFILAQNARRRSPDPSIRASTSNLDVSSIKKPPLAGSATSETRHTNLRSGDSSNSSSLPCSNTKESQPSSKERTFSAPRNSNILQVNGAGISHGSIIADVPKIQDAGGRPTARNVKPVPGAVNALLKAAYMAPSTASNKRAKDKAQTHSAIPPLVSDGPTVMASGSAPEVPIVSTASHSNNSRLSSEAKPLPATSPPGKLGNYNINLEMRRENSGLPLNTWRDLSEILLRTGMTRHKSKD